MVSDTKHLPPSGPHGLTPVSYTHLDVYKRQTIVYVAGIAFNYITAALEKRRVTSTFKKYVAPQIVQEILDSGNPEALMVGGRVVNIAVLFVDIRGFTTMSERCV